MATVDVLSQGIGVKGLALRVVSGESVLGVRDVETTVARTLESTEHSASSRGLSQSDIKEDFEWSTRTLGLLSEGVTAIGLSDTLVLVCKTNLGQGATGNKKASGICGSPVFETVVDSVLGQFRRVCGCEDNIALELGVDDLADLWEVRRARTGAHTTVVLVNRTTRRYLGVAYRFFAWVMSLFRA